MKAKNELQRICASILALAMAASMSGCGETAPDGKTDEPNPSVSVTAAETAAAETTAAGGQSDPEKVTEQAAEETQAAEESTAAADIINAYVNDENHLIVEMSDGSTVDNGYVGADEQSDPNAPIYEVRFLDYNGDPIGDVQYIPRGGNAVPPDAPLKDGYTFLKWAPEYEKVQHNLTISAIYEKKSEPDTAVYSVTFLDYDGTVLKKEEVEAGKPASAPADPVRKGYVFNGWDGDFQSVSGTMVVMAQYEQSIPEAGEITVKAADVTAKAGKKVFVPVSISGNPGVAGATIQIYYDEGLTLKNGKSGDAFSVLTMTKPGVMKNGCNFIWDSLEIKPEDVKDGEILILEFQVSSEAKPGEVFEVRTDYVYGDIFNNDMMDLTLDMAAGSVTIQ